MRSRRRRAPRRHRELALLFKDLATLRSDARLFATVEELRWRGPSETFPAVPAQIGDHGLLARSLSAAQKRLSG